jgi:hypothetical protein
MPFVAVKTKKMAAAQTVPKTARRIPGRLGSPTGKTYDCVLIRQLCSMRSRSGKWDVSLFSQTGDWPCLPASLTRLWQTSSRASGPPIIAVGLVWTIGDWTRPVFPRFNSPWRKRPITFRPRPSVTDFSWHPSPKSLMPSLHCARIHQADLGRSVGAGVPLNAGTGGGHSGSSSAGCLLSRSPDPVEIRRPG